MSTQRGGTYEKTQVYIIGERKTERRRRHTAAGRTKAQGQKWKSCNKKNPMQGISETSGGRKRKKNLVPCGTRSVNGKNAKKRARNRDRE